MCSISLNELWCVSSVPFLSPVYTILERIRAVIKTWRIGLGTVYTRDYCPGTLCHLERKPNRIKKSGMGMFSRIFSRMFVGYDDDDDDESFNPLFKHG